MIKRIIVLLICALSIIMITGCDDINSANSSSSKSTVVDLSKNIKSSGALTDKGKLVVFVTNENDVEVDMKIEVEFYDSNGVIVGSDSEDLKGVGSKADIAVDMYKTPDTFDNYKIYVDVEKTKNYTYYDSLELVHNNNGKEIVVQVKNNSNDSIDWIGLSVVFYQGEKVVGFADGIKYDIKSGRSANLTLDYPYNKEYDKVQFDNYKVFINEAFTYNYSFNW